MKPQKILFLALSSILFTLSHTARAAEPPEPEEGKAVIVFYRPSKMKGAAIPFNLDEAGKRLTTLSNGKAFTPIPPTPPRSRQPGRYLRRRCARWGSAPRNFQENGNSKMMERM